MPNQALLSPSWKQEVNQRIAAHKNRKTTPAAERDAFPQQHHTASQRAAAAAARVAARFAKAPSYNEQLKQEARAALRAAEAVSRAALEAQAAAESVLAELEADRDTEPGWELHSSATTVSSPTTVLDQTSNAGVAEGSQEAVAASGAVEKEPFERRAFEISWEPDLPVLEPAPVAVRENYGEYEDRSAQNATDSWREGARQIHEAARAEAIEVVEPAIPIHANLIEFPRELVATRKVRPRRAEGPLAADAEPGAQLSIFEVDPGAISITPTAGDAIDAASAPVWTGPEWSGIELDAQPQREFLEEAAEQLLPEAADDAVGSEVVEQAPVSLRVMATVVDTALIMGAFLVAAMMAADNARTLASLRQLEAASAVGLLVVGSLYTVLFFALANVTPGMRYAGISLCAFDGQVPTRAQRMSRLAAMLLSVLPVGLGMLWAIFDDDHLSWHDRLSRTYLRRS